MRKRSLISTARSPWYSLIRPRQQEIRKRKRRRTPPLQNPQGSKALPPAKGSGQAENRNWKRDKRKTHLANPARMGHPKAFFGIKARPPAFLAAPLGEKYCHYERTVSITRWGTSQANTPIVSYDDGKTWSSFDPAGEKVPQYSTVKAVYIGWEKKEDRRKKGPPVPVCNKCKKHSNCLTTDFR